MAQLLAEPGRLHPRHGDHTPWLDRSGPVWFGRLPGLGSVRVDPDGGIEVELDDGPDDRREAALRRGWGEPLSLARRGFRLAHGTALADPEPARGSGPAAGPRALLLTGATAESSTVAVRLAADGWPVLADGLVPLTREADGWLVHPRDAGLLAARRVLRAAGVAGEEIRVGGDGCLVPSARPATAPARLSGVLRLRARSRPEPTALTPHTGAERLRAAAFLLAGGVLAPGEPVDPGARLALHCSLAAVPAAQLALDRDAPEDGLERLRAWFADPGAAR